MNCENRLCVYQTKGVCTVEEISVDALGMCADCVYPNFSDELLEKEKTKVLKRYNQD